MNNVVAVPGEGDPSGVLLSSGCKAGPDVYGAPIRNYRGKKDEGIELETTSSCY